MRFILGERNSTPDSSLTHLVSVTPLIRTHLQSASTKPPTHVAPAMEVTWPHNYWSTPLTASPTHTTEKHLEVNMWACEMTRWLRVLWSSWVKFSAHTGQLDLLYLQLQRLRHPTLTPPPPQALSDTVLLLTECTGLRLSVNMSISVPMHTGVQVCAHMGAHVCGGQGWCGSLP